MGRPAQQPALSGERGIALALVVFALVVVGALVAAAFFAGIEEQRAGENSHRLERALGVAEAGAYEVIRAWDRERWNPVRIYPLDSAPIRQTRAPAGTGSYRGYVYRLNRNLYLVDVLGSDAVDSSGRISWRGARQRVGLLVRIQPLQMDPAAALTTRGAVNLSGSVSVDGNDHSPEGPWECPPPDSGRAGVLVAPGSAVTGAEGRTAGSPPVRRDTSLADSSSTRLDSVTYVQLAARASITLAPGEYSTQPAASEGLCDRSVLTNWGGGTAPDSPCADYAPVVHVTGDLALRGGQGQGILLVDGDLAVQGDYQFFGIAIVRGRLSTPGSGGGADVRFWGAVHVGETELGSRGPMGTVVVGYSKCLIDNVLWSSAPVVLLGSRRWAQLF